MSAEHRPAATYPRHRPGQEVAPSPRLPDVEREVLAYWESDGTFQASIDSREAGENGSNEFVFYDGPPFANGLPHYGHLLTGYVKDLVGRFQTQRGRRVERRFGWDTHGLPAELEAERELGITDKSQIDELGIEKFNETCRTSVLRYTQQWRDYVTRQARWVDFDNDYKTFDLGYMESVIWAFKELYDKGLAYEGYRVLPYCWQDQTPLSNHELRMDEDVYQMRQDPSITVGVRLESGELALVWTTTPWTLPANLSIAVGPEVSYVTVAPTEGPLAGERVLLAEDRLAAYARELGEDAPVVARSLGSDLAGRRYAPVFDYFTSRDDLGERVWTILAADYVSVTDGTGLVHQAPAFGEEDMAVSAAAGITTVVPIDGAGRFTNEVHDYAGMHVFDANRPIIADLKAGSGALARRPDTERARLVRQETIDHSYPHCWRCRNPLIYKAVTSWFVRVTAFRDRMVELNEQITWVPEHLRDGQFGNWLAGARDWSISRNRYWGTPIPVWVSDDPTYPRVDVYGSLAELQRDFGRLPTNPAGEVDLHRPYIDELTRPNPDDPTGKSTMRRIPDILDVWFDSGAMPFAQVHYPFENAEWFDHHYPGDFIVEYIGQTRGWFYTLHVLATALFDRPAFRTAVSHGIVLGSDGRKMSKSLRNYPDVDEVFNRDGSDAMRWFLMASSVVRGGNLIVTEEGIREHVRQVLLPVWSTWYFLSLYAGAANQGRGAVGREVTPAEAAELPVMDRYLLARTRTLADEVGELLERYDVPAATVAVRDHIDLLTNWYVRTSRDRFWGEDPAAFNTLHTALEVLMRVMAPLAPLLSEEIWRGLTGERSVHLTDWPTLDEAFADDDLVATMDRVRESVSATLSLRKAAAIRVRQPLRRLRVVAEGAAALAPFTALIAEEVNVKNVDLEELTEASAQRYGVQRRLSVNARLAGPRLGRDVQRVIRAAREGDWHTEGDQVIAGGIALQEEEYTISTEVDTSEAADVAATMLPGGGFIVLDLELDDDLRAEGLARDVIRKVQDARKEAGLHVADRISLRLGTPAQHETALREHQGLIAQETLAQQVEVHVVAHSDITVDLAKIDAPEGS